MGIYLDTGNRVHSDDVAQRLECPHCGKRSNMRTSSVLDFGQLQIDRPNEIGMALHCDACNKPVFVRYRVRSYRPDRIDFFAAEQLTSRSTETFVYAYLPEAVAENFRDALGCYSHELRNAFVVMCRRTALAAFESLGERGKLQCYEHAAEIQRLAQIDPQDFEITRHIIFEMDLNDRAAVPTITRMQAVVLLEVMKDMLNQAYVRGEQLRKALQLRRYFAEQTDTAMFEKTVGKDDAVEPEMDGDRDHESMIVRAMKRAGRH